MFSQHCLLFLLPKNLTSWVEADKLCRDAGGTLPYFFSRDELYEFLTLIKFTEKLDPLQAVYIGLTLNNTDNVSHEYFIWCMFLYKELKTM